MLLENLRYYKEASRMTYEQIAEESKTPLSTIKNIFSGKSEPLASTLYRISQAFKVPLENLLADANVVLSSTSIIAVQETLAEVQENAEVVEAEKDLALRELEALRAKNDAQEKEIALLKERLQHKEELLAVYNYFTKTRPAE